MTRRSEPWEVAGGDGHRRLKAAWDQIALEHAEWLIRIAPKEIVFDPELPDDPESRALGRIRSAEIRAGVLAYLTR